MRRCVFLFSSQTCDSSPGIYSHSYENSKIITASLIKDETNMYMPAQVYTHIYTLTMDAGKRTEANGTHFKEMPYPKKKKKMVPKTSIL